jgi:hypothetical protein
VFCDEATRVVCEDVGVPWAELAGEWFAEPPCEGDAVPELEESPFFFPDLLESLFLESCCCLQCQKGKCGEDSK